MPVPQAVNIGEFVSQFRASGGVVIRSYDSCERLIKIMQSTIDEGKKVLFYPSHRSLRYFFNSAGFISEMTQVSSQLLDFEVIFEPQVFDQKHIFVIAPKLDDPS